MNYKLLFASLAIGLGAMATSAAAAPTGNLSGVNAVAGSKLLQTVRDDYRDYRRDNRWSRNDRWDDNDYRGHRRWWWHRRHHDHDNRWSWNRDRNDRDGHRHR
jgi:hypothetical protein